MNKLTYLQNQELVIQFIQRNTDIICDSNKILWFGIPYHAVNNQRKD